MPQKRMMWDRPSGSGTPNRPGDGSPEPIFLALGKALSAWEGVNAAVNNLHFSLIRHLGLAFHEVQRKAFDALHKTQERAGGIRRVGANFLAADFDDHRGEAARLKKRLSSALARYEGWAARRNELAHGYVTEAQCPDYSQPEQPIITVYALLPSHARSERWFKSQPEWNYLAAEVGEFARQFGSLDNLIEDLAEAVSELRQYRLVKSEHDLAKELL